MWNFPFLFLIGAVIYTRSFTKKSFDPIVGYFLKLHFNRLHGLIIWTERKSMAIVLKKQQNTNRAQISTISRQRNQCPFRSEAFSGARS